MAELTGPSRFLSRDFWRAFGLTLAIWLIFVYGAYVTSELIAGRIGFLRDLPLDVPAVLLVALTAQALYPLAVYGADRSSAFRWISVILATIVVAIVQSLINLVENRMLGVIPAIDAAHLDLIRSRFGKSFLSHLYLSFANGALFVFMVETRRGAAQRMRLVEAQVLAETARAAALRLQLNPHFLFNTLNSVSSLVVTGRNDEAEEMLALLSEFLRLSLNADPSALVPLQEEYATIEAYLDIEAVRFGDRMDVELTYPPALSNAAVPSFILQPLVENALKYGVSRSSGPTKVRIVARHVGGDVVLEVTNTSDAPFDEGGVKGLGIGLENIRQRLASRYGDRAELVVAGAGGRFSAIVTIPFANAVAPTTTTA